MWDPTSCAYRKKFGNLRDRLTGAVAASAEDAGQRPGIATAGGAAGYNDRELGFQLTGRG